MKQNLNIAMLNESKLNVITPFGFKKKHNVGGSPPQPDVPSDDVWQWDNGDTLLWDDGSEILTTD